MPKMKTNSSAKKRVKVTATGKFKMQQAGKRQRLIMILQAFPRRFGEIEFNERHVEPRRRRGLPRWTIRQRTHCLGLGTRFIDIRHTHIHRR